MKQLLVALAVVLAVSSTVRAQCGQTRTFVTNSGYQNSSVVISNTGNYNYGNTAVVVKQTGYPDVAAVGGVVLVPAQIKGGHHGVGVYNNAAVIVPQSTFFFAASNPNVFEFRTREFLQVPGTDQIITTDGFGNDVILNAGVRHGSTIQSRGTLLYRR